jgi:hypothetical protein
MSFPGLNFDLSTPSWSSNERDTQSEAIREDQDLLPGTRLPSHDILIELVDLFFEHLYEIFPCFNRKTFRMQVQLGAIEQQCPLVLFAMCCIAARFHPEVAIRQCEKEWYEQAKLLYHLTQRDPYPGLLTIQAALLIVVYACTAGDFSSAWLFLGKAWRQAIALGMNRMDVSTATSTGLKLQDLNDNDQDTNSGQGKRNMTAADKEEQRRTMWLLFIVDRNHSWPVGWPNAVPETHFKIDMPVADSVFQAMEAAADDSVCGNTPFTRNLDRLIRSCQSAGEPVNVFHYICVAHILLGRVVELVYSLHDAPDTPEYAEDCDELDSHIVKFRLSIPRQATSILEAQPADRGQVVWLQVVLNTCVMLLNHRCANNVSSADASSPFMVAVAAARDTAQIVKDASRVSIEPLISPHIASSLYVAVLLLVIQWRTTGDPKLKEEIDLFALVFDRMNDAFVFLGLKFSYALEHDLERSQGDHLEELRDRSLRGLLADCTKWTHIKDKIVQRGIPIDIT